MLKKWTVSAASPLLFTNYKIPACHPNDDTEAIVYYMGTGDVHLVTRQGADLLKLISENGPLNETELTELFLHAYPSNQEKVTSDDLLEALVTPFASLGLIQLADI